MKKKFLISVFIIFLIITLILTGMINREKYILKNKEHSTIMTDNTLAIMYETSIDSGEYTNSKDSIWPLNGYIFNSTLSKCENGSEISWDDTNKKVIVSGISSDKCYVYFDKLIITLASHIKSKFTTQGANNLYHHDGTLGNGINDGSYRYSGAYESVNNWVCFGSNEATCPSNNLYRIIGVFNQKVLNADGTDSGKTEERVKLIMNDYPGESVLGKAQDGTKTPYSSFTGASKPSGTISGYAWSGSTSTSTVSNNWLTSTFNTMVLNGTYLTNLGSEWTNKIALTEWKAGGNNYNNIYSVKASTSYQNEIVSPAASTIDNKKVGLMYASDYGFAASKENWTTNLASYSNDANRNNNWLYRGVMEWTITPRSDHSGNGFYVNSNGDLVNGAVFYDNGARPSFYLDASVAYAGGEGTQTNPYRIG